MGAPIVLAFVWAISATVTAVLPLRWQFAPGIVLLAAAPPLILWLGLAHGGWVAALAFCAVLSMFRRPLLHIWTRVRGQRPGASG